MPFTDLICMAERIDADADRFRKIRGFSGPRLWQQILNEIGCESAIVAGGAVRDYLLGTDSPKDIDIFAPSWGFNPPSIFESLGEAKGEEYMAMDNIDIVMRAKIAGLQVDLVGLNRFDSPAEVVETFDFGITRCWFDGQIHDTPWARYDRTNRIVSLLIGDRRERAQARFDRFNLRMGGAFTLVDRT